MPARSWSAPVAALLALPLAVLLSRAAYLLPRALGVGMAAEPSLAHRRWRNGFRIACLGMAMLCAWRFGATPCASALTWLRRGFWA